MRERRQQLIDRGFGAGRELREDHAGTGSQVSKVSQATATHTDRCNVAPGNTTARRRQQCRCFHQFVVVVDLNHTMPAQKRRGGFVGAGQRARMGGGRPGAAN